MLDGGKNDEKIIAIPFTDPGYNGHRELTDLPAHIFDEMAHFFAVYKALEGKEACLLYTSPAWTHRPWPSADPAWSPPLSPSSSPSPGGPFSWG